MFSGFAEKKEAKSMNKKTGVWIGVLLLIAIIVVTIIVRNDLVNAYEEVLRAEAKVRSTIELSEELIQLFENVGGYEKIKESEQFADMINDLANSKMCVTIACNEYEDVVMRYNKNVSVFPRVVFAKLFGYDEIRINANIEQEKKDSAVVGTASTKDNVVQQVAITTQADSDTSSKSVVQFNSKNDSNANSISSILNSYFVQDNAGVLRNEDVNIIADRSRRLYNAYNIRVMIATVAKLENETIDDAASRIAIANDIDMSGMGILLLFSVDDDTITVLLGEKIQKMITVEEANKLIVKKVVPSLSNKKYAKGFENLQEELINKVKKCGIEKKEHSTTVLMERKISAGDILHIILLVLLFGAIPAISIIKIYQLDRENKKLLAKIYEFREKGERLVLQEYLDRHGKGADIEMFLHEYERWKYSRW